MLFLFLRLVYVCFVHAKCRKEGPDRADVHRTSPRRRKRRRRRRDFFFLKSRPCTNQAGAHKMHKYLFLSSSNSNSLHMSKSQLRSAFSAIAHTRTLARAACTHAPGGRDSAAELITRNGSIRRSVMINPVESPLPRSVTCRAAPPSVAPPCALRQERHLVACGPAQGHREAAKVTNIDGLFVPRCRAQRVLRDLFFSVCVYALK